MFKKILFFVMVFSVCYAAYADKLPNNIISLDSQQGLNLFYQEKAKSSFWKLFQKFETQKNLTFCSIASSVMVLNALNVNAPQDPNYGKYNVFSQENFFNGAVNEIINLNYVLKNGVTLDQIAKAIASYGVLTNTYHANKSSLAQFRKIALDALHSNNQYVIVNFDRKALGEIGVGHMSPIADYNSKTDRFLILDVARYRYPPSWITAKDLFAAMDSFDQDANNYRGFIVITKEVHKSQRQGLVETSQ